MLALPKATVAAWCFGQGYVNREGTTRTFKSLIVPADRQRRILSFANLCELHVLAVIRRHHGINMATVRDSLRYVERRLGERRPLIAQAFLTNGVDLFIEKAAQLINVSRDGQIALRGGFEQALARIDRDRTGGPIRLFPYTRISPQLTDQPKSIAVDPQLAFGRPVLLSAGVTTDVIRDRFMAGDSAAEMADDYGVNAAEIDEALRFEQRLVA